MTLQDLQTRFDLHETHYGNSAPRAGSLENRLSDIDRAMKAFSTNHTTIEYKISDMYAKFYALQAGLYERPTTANEDADHEWGHP